MQADVPAKGKDILGQLHRIQIKCPKTSFHCHPQENESSNDPERRDWHWRVGFPCYIYCYHPQTGKRTSGVYIHWSNYIKSTKETLCAQIIKDKILVIIAAIPSKFGLPHHQIMVLITLKYVYEYISMYKHASYIHTKYMLSMHLNTNKFLSFFKGSQSLHRKWP